MNALSSKTVIPGNVAINPSRELPVKILQFGEGNFLRAFADWMIDVLNEKELFDGSILVVNNTRRGSVEPLKAQDCRYTLATRGVANGQRVDSRRLITSISSALNPYSEWSKLLEAVHSEELRFFISNTTEAGIVYKTEPFKAGECPESFPAKCAALLASRAAAFRFDATKGGILLLPCELIERNGAALREAVLKHLADWGLKKEAAWVEGACVFANTLVDRIVPGRPSPEDAEAFRKELGYEDKMLVAAEPFHFWAIEAPERVWESIPFRKGGLNVVWSADITPYRQRKVHLLNATHTANVFGAYLAGVRTVREMMEHPLFGKEARKSLFDELMPTVPLPEAERRAFAEAVVERFLNPFIKHELISITLNSVSKWKARVLPPLLKTVQGGKAIPPHLAFSLATLAVFYRGTEAKDDKAALDAFSKAWAANDSAAVLADTTLWGMDLTTLPGFRELFVRNVDKILSQGVEKALQEI